MRAGERGLEDPEGRCDPELELVQPLGKVYSRAFDRVTLLNREGRGFLILNSIKLEPMNVKNDGARKQGASMVELSNTGVPVRQCFATSRGFEGESAGIRDAALDPQGRLALTGWIWGNGLSFGGESISAPNRYRSSYLAVLTGAGKHAFSAALGGPTWNDATSVASDAHGNVVVAGTIFHTLKLGALELPIAESPGLYVAKFDPEGRLAWARVSPFASQHVAPTVTFTDGGNVLVAGSYGQELDFGTPLPRARPLELPGCAAEKGRVSEGRRMFVVELDATGRQVRADSFGDPYAAAYDVTTSPEGDLIVTGAFRGRLSLVHPVLVAPASPAKCECNVDCAYPYAPFVARLDRRRRLVFQEALPGTRILRATPGPARSTILEQGIVVSFRKTWGETIPADYRWRLDVRSPAGTPEWSRTFEKLDLKSSTALGSGRVAVLVHDPDSSVLYFMLYARSPTTSSAAPR